VLKEVSEPGSADLLVSGPDMIPGIHRYYRSGVILVEDYLEAIGKGVFLELDPRCRLGTRGGGSHGPHK